MNDYLVLKLDDNLEVIDIDSRPTSGLAHQQALRVSDDGFKCRVVSPEDAHDVLYLFDQVKQKRELGFIRESGHIPNGSRHGGGCRTIGNMIYPSFGGMLERTVETETSPTDPGNANRNNSVPLPLSSKEIQTVPQKIVVHMRKYGLS